MCYGEFNLERRRSKKNEDPKTNQQQKKKRTKLNEERLAPAPDPQNVVVYLCFWSVYDAAAMVFVKSYKMSICCLTHIHIAASLSST